MTNKKKVKSKLKLFLRRMGMLCKTKTKTKSRIRVSKTILPNGDEIIHPPYLLQVPTNQHSFESELHVYHETRKSLNK